VLVPCKRKQKQQLLQRQAICNTAVVKVEAGLAGHVLFRIWFRLFARLIS